jgi:hypothetical protein
MKSKSIYVLQTGGLSKIDNQFHFYELEVFSSKKKIEREIENRILVNKGTDVVRDEGYCGTGTKSNVLVTYNCLSTDGQPMRIRYQLLEKKLN